MRIAKALLILLPFLSFGITKAQSVQWAYNYGSVNEETAYAAYTDESGFIYTCGYFDAANKFFERTICGNHDIYVAKHDAQGNLLWVQFAGSSANDIGWAVKADSDGNVYVAGTIEGTANFGTDTLYNNALMNAFVAKYDASGEFQWARQAGGYMTQCFSLALDSDNNIHITGYFQGTATFGNVTHTSAGQGDLYLAKYNSNGDFQWVRTGGGKKHDDGYAVAIDKDNSIYVTGVFADTAMFGQHTVVSKGSADVFLLKYTSQGDLVWANNWGGAGRDAGNSLHADPRGGCILAGSFNQSIQVGPASLVSAGGTDMFITSIENTGSTRWARSAGGPGRDEASHVFTDTLGNIFITGGISDSCSFSGQALPSNGMTDIFASKYGLDGSLGWVRSWGGTSADIGFGITANQNGVFVCGTLQDSVLFGNTVLGSYGLNDAFLAKLEDLPVSAAPLRMSETEPFEIFPNPSTGTLNIITGYDVNGASITLYNSSGQELYHTVLDGSAIIADVSFLPKGIYLLCFRQQAALPVNKKLVIQ